MPSSPGFSWHDPHAYSSHPASTPRTATPTLRLLLDDLKQAIASSYKTYTGKVSPSASLMTATSIRRIWPSTLVMRSSPCPATQPLTSTADHLRSKRLFETHLDLQQSGGMAPDAKIILIQSPDLSDRAYRWLSRSFQTNKLDVVSMSFAPPRSSTLPPTTTWSINLPDYRRRMI